MRAKARSWLAVAVATSVLAGGCERSADQTPAEAAPSGVVFVLVDALRADRLGCYGNPRNASPNLDALAKDGTLFRNAIAPAPWTLPTMATLWTSLSPSVHGATRISDLSPQDVRPVAVLDESRVTFAEVMRDNGFQTAAFVDGTYPRRVFGLAQGFDLFLDAERPGIRLNVEALLDWLDRERPERFFAYVHTLEVHSPYTPDKLLLPENAEPDDASRRMKEVLAEERKRYAEFDFNPGYRGRIHGYWTMAKPGHERRNLDPLPEADQEQLVALYDRGVAYADYWIGQLIQGLAERGLLEHTVVVITSDHGDELLDHGGVEHGETFYDEMIRVPLIVRVPGLAQGRVIEPQVGLVDLMPTLLDLLRVPHDLFLQGRSFVPLLKGERWEEAPVFSEASIFGPHHGSVRTRDWKYIESREGTELYDLRGDPGERKNVCASQEAVCASFAEQLHAWRVRNANAAQQLGLPAAAQADVDEETKQRLRALGYAD
jgi:arylsulfatase A-like enzyme